MPFLSLLGNGLLLLAALGLAVSIVRRRVNPIGVIALWLAIAVLLLALVFDRFELSYVAAYSARRLPVWLKLATIWGGEQGSLLLLAALNALLAWRYRQHSPASSHTLSLLALAFTLAAGWWTVFAPAIGPLVTDGRGMNAHLTSVWMAIHPPAIFLAYALLWAPLGAVLQALHDDHAAGQWRAMMLGPALAGWCLLSIGVASGMWWAFQDFNYGQFWHWDPVQTAVLMLWLLATAQLHGARSSLPGRPAPRLLLWTGVLLAWTIPMALWVVRDATLASSHRYVGDTSWPVLAAVTAAVTLAALWRIRSGRRCGSNDTAVCKTGVIEALRAGAWATTASRTGPGGRRRAGGQRRLLHWGALTLLMGAIAVGAALAYSYACAVAQCNRDFAPFRQSLLSWVQGEEAGRIARAFDQWEVDHFIATALLLPVMAVIVLLVGYTFLRPVVRHAGRWTIAFALLATAAARLLQPLTQHFDGTGVTTSHTVARLGLLEVLLFACAWPVLATLVWLYRAWQRQAGAIWRYSAPVAAIHLGVMALIVGATISTTLDSTRQATLNLPTQYGQAVAIGDGIHLSVQAPQWSTAHDGAIDDAASLLAVSEVSMMLSEAGASRPLGSTVYRDSALELGTGQGVNSFRQRCMVLDHRFARVLERPGLMMHPAISHGLLTDIQLWMPAPAPASSDTVDRQVLLIMRRFPLLSMLWTGLILVVSGALALVWSGLRIDIHRS